MHAKQKIFYNGLITVPIAQKSLQCQYKQQLVHTTLIDTICKLALQYLVRMFLVSTFFYDSSAIDKGTLQSCTVFQITIIVFTNKTPFSGFILPTCRQATHCKLTLHISRAEQKLQMYIFYHWQHSCWTTFQLNCEEKSLIPFYNDPKHILIRNVWIVNSQMTKSNPGSLFHLFLQESQLTS